MLVADFMLLMASHTGVPSAHLRLWSICDRENKTYRVERLLHFAACLDTGGKVDTHSKKSKKRHYYFLEVVPKSAADHGDPAHVPVLDDLYRYGAHAAASDLRADLAAAKDGDDADADSDAGRRRARAQRNVEMWGPAQARESELLPQYEADHKAALAACYDVSGLGDTPPRPASLTYVK